METSHEHTAIHWKFSSLTGSNYFWDIKEYTGKEQVLRNRFLWDFFYISSRFGLLCNLSYSDFFTNWEEIWRVSLFFYSTMATVTFPCGLDRICNFFAHKQSSLTCCMWSTICLTKVFDLLYYEATIPRKVNLFKLFTSLFIILSYQVTCHPPASWQRIACAVRTLVFVLPKHCSLSFPLLLLCLFWCSFTVWSPHGTKMKREGEKVITWQWLDVQ